MQKLRPIQRLLLIGNSLVIIASLLSAYLPYLSPGSYWLSGFAGLLFPITSIIAACFIPIWIICKRWPLATLSTIALLCCTKAIYVTFGLHPTPQNASRDQEQQFTVMTFNTSNMGLRYYTHDSSRVTAIYNALQHAQPDILCLQEFYTNDKPELTDHLQRIVRSYGYNYHYFTCDRTHWDTWRYGIILFSKHPILNAISIPCGNNPNGSGSSFLQADLRIHQDTVRIFTAQLKSYMLNANDYPGMAFGQQHNTPAGSPRHLLAKMRNTFATRARQAESLASLAATSPYPFIICGDFNDTPVSYTYFTISNGLQDAFLHHGQGLGRTLSYLSPTLRIDYILAHQQFNIHGFSTFRNALLEHYPIMASFSLKKE
ncbi:endonuclease/exonuclease/phosphatase family protein [Chitinophaga pendula]|uniref:endonuclease/exonuclease/phosphatase family protein n=1 Tax=Chitinophaga TaxID=79328 RepID=UPI000BAEFE28|nr:MULTISPECIES: endonuclease/exonuclease/phosphatase family protein [Chitinophaga]ASZ10469.1 hypothetical protein CK934_05500 [Chitinophaga sp. MD30]UCJ06561.1 endonuclease/exonuclease/phosphatase family protein [Chitinophaga pendula]